MTRSDSTRLTLDYPETRRSLTAFESEHSQMNSQYMALAHQSELSETDCELEHFVQVQLEIPLVGSLAPLLIDVWVYIEVDHLKRTLMGLETGFLKKPVHCQLDSNIPIDDGSHTSVGLTGVLQGTQKKSTATEQNAHSEHSLRTGLIVILNKSKHPLAHAQHAGLTVAQSQQLLEVIPKKMP